MMGTRRDLSISMEKANVIVLFISLPVVIVQFAIFLMLHGTDRLRPLGSPVLLIIAVLLGIVIHEWIHGFSWMIFGGKACSATKSGFQLTTLTPYAPLKESV